MSHDWPSLRIEGIYRQPVEGFGMLRIKLPAGVLSAPQAHGIAALSTTFARGTLHLTTRGSIELHWVRGEDLAAVKGGLAQLGLTSRGACGGAVRGITCACPGGSGFPRVESLARRLQRQFTGNPRYERLPKKFKIGIFEDVTSRGHLIQDVALVLRDNNCFDIWIAGGLGREPQAGFLLEEKVAEGRIIPLIEAILSVYSAHAPSGKRLKHVARELGEDVLRKLITGQPSAVEELSPPTGIPDHFVPEPSVSNRLDAPVFGGQLTADDLSRLAGVAETCGGGWLLITADQNVAFHVTGDVAVARQELIRLGFGGTNKDEQISFRICPGSHECRMGLAPTRDVARQVIDALGPVASAARWAVSGCLNSCAQPQIADYGIIAAALVKGDDGSRTPRYQLHRNGGEGLGELVKGNLNLEELLDAVSSLG